MPSYSYDTNRKVWFKYCSRCKTETLGTNDEKESVKIFLGFYSENNGKSQTRDGLQSRCWECNSAGRRQLGITRTILQEMFDAQGGKCAICIKDITIERRAPADIHAHVDHNDETGKVRELLCGHCNRAIGLLRHDVNILWRAARYIQKHTVVIPIKIVRRL